MRRLARRAAFLSTVTLVLSWPARASAARLRVVTFNVAMGLGFRQPFTGWIQSTFEHHSRIEKFDVIGLQEACAGGRSIALFRAILLRAYGRVYQHSVPDDPNTKEACKKSQVILSRYPFTDRGMLQLPRVGANRSAAWVDLKVGTESVRVYNLHLSNRAGSNLTPIERRWVQARPVLEHFLEYRNQHPRRHHALVLGDFNSLGKLWDPWRSELSIRNLSRYLRPSIRGYMPTMFLPYKTDWIFSSGLRLLRSNVIPTVYSDHFVVVADYRL